MVTTTTLPTMRSLTLQFTIGSLMFFNLWEFLHSDHRNDAILHSAASQLFAKQQHAISNASATTNSWIGNMWIPPVVVESSSLSNRLYSIEEFRDYFGDKSICFIGDSTARRVFTTLYHILNTTTHFENNNNISAITKSELESREIIDVNRKNSGVIENCPTDPTLRLCRSIIMRNEIFRADLLSLRCFRELAETMETFDFSRYNLIVIGMGTWSLAQLCNNTINDVEEMTTDILQAVNSILMNQNHQRDNLTIVWRTTGNVGRSNKATKLTLSQAYHMNQAVKNKIQAHTREYQERTSKLSSLSILDWGEVMSPRSHPVQDRIAGDIAEHYGFEARMVLLQMLINHLVERDRQKAAMNLH